MWEWGDKVRIDLSYFGGRQGVISRERQNRSEHTALERSILRASDQGFPYEEIRFRHWS